jgi:hypothetical protein
MIDNNAIQLYIQVKRMQTNEAYNVFDHKVELFSVWKETQRGSLAFPFPSLPALAQIPREFQRTSYEVH